jgi:hypothetical protein
MRHRGLTVTPIRSVQGDPQRFLLAAFAPAGDQTAHDVGDNDPGVDAETPEAFDGVRGDTVVPPQGAASDLVTARIRHTPRRASHASCPLETGDDSVPKRFTFFLEFGENS